MAEEIFNVWLTKKLQSFEVEDEVLGCYISSIITTDECDSEKEDSLRDILLDLLHDVNVDDLCREILNKWSECHSQSKKDKADAAGKNELDLSQKVALLVGQQVQSVVKPIRSEEEEKLREAILTRCTFVSSDEEEGESDEVGAGSTSHPAPAKNQNAEAVAQADKERRNKLKTESDEKKAQDKVNREKQKVKQDERREKERKRTQKQERRR